MNHPDAAGTAEVLDPVCGMTIEPADAAGVSEVGGTTVYFCSTACKKKFDADPAQYGGKGQSGGTCQSHGCCH